MPQGKKKLRTQDNKELCSFSTFHILEWNGGGAQARGIHLGTPLPSLPSGEASKAKQQKRG